MTNTTISGIGTVVSSSTVSGSGNSLTTIAGGLVISCTFVNGGVLIDGSGGTDVRDLVMNGGSLSVGAGGRAVSDTINSASATIGSGGGEAYNLLISGAVETVSAGGFADATTVSGRATLLANGGSLLGTLATGNAATIVVQSAGILDGGTVISGAVEETLAGGIAAGTLLVSGGIEYVAGEAEYTVVQSGCEQSVTGGGTVISASISGGDQILDGGYATRDTIASGGVAIISAGGHTSLDMVLAGGNEFIASGGTASGILNSGGEVLLSAGGIESGGTVIGGSVFDGGTDIVLSGGTAIGEQVSSGGLELVVGGVASGTSVLASGIQVIESGGIASGTIISGTQILSFGGTAIDATVASNGILAISSGGFASGTTISGAQILSSGGTAIDATVASYGILAISSGGIASGTTISGGHVILSSGGTDTGVTFAGSGGELTLSAGATFAGTVSGFLTATGGTTGNTLELAGFGGKAVVGSTTAGTLTVTSGGSSVTLDVANATAGRTYTTTIDPNGGIDVVPCFLEGTHVLTEAGDVAIETLSVGDRVMTRATDGTMVAQPIVWLGKRSLEAAHLPDVDRYPVRIRADAFADGVPHRDLLITPEHCVFVDGGLVPVRMLVNGGSIVIDRTICAYTIYHLETARHSVLVTEGLTTESYLDTGNRKNFGVDGAIALRPDVSLNETSLSWNDAAAPLSVERRFVEPIWTTLASRAAELGFAQTTTAPVLTTDADLHLVIDNGATVRASEVLGDRHLFRIPEGTTTIHLASRASAPSDVIGPFVDDRRQLGVMVADVICHFGRHRTVQDSHLIEAALSGWFGLDGKARWTDGLAMLPVDLAPAAGKSLLLEVQIVAAGPYVLAGETGASAAA